MRLTTAPAQPSVISLVRFIAACTWTALAALAKRLHDVGASGGLCLLVFCSAAGHFTCRADVVCRRHQRQQSLWAGDLSLQAARDLRGAARRRLTSLRDFEISPERAIAAARPHAFCSAANSSASSRRSLPQNISVPTKNVGAPKIPRRRASSVCSRKRVFAKSVWACSRISAAGRPSSRQYRSEALCFVDVLIIHKV